MGVLMLALLGCGPAPDPQAGPCDGWTMEVGQAPVYGGGPAHGDPGDWPLDTARRLSVAEGLVQLMEIDVPRWGDFAVQDGLLLEGWWDDRDALTYDAPLLLWPAPLEARWSAEATFRDATLQGIKNGGVDLWEAEVIAVEDLVLDGYTFGDVRTVDATLTRELAVSSGPVVQQERLWLSECYGLLAREHDGKGRRLVPGAE